MPKATLSSSSKTPARKTKRQLARTKLLLSLFVLMILLIGSVVGYVLVQSNQDTRQQAYQANIGGRIIAPPSDNPQNRGRTPIGTLPSGDPRNPIRTETQTGSSCQAPFVMARLVGDNSGNFYGLKDVANYINETISSSGQTQFTLEVTCSDIPNGYLFLQKPNQQSDNLGQSSNQAPARVVIDSPGQWGFGCVSASISSCIASEAITIVAPN